MQTRAQMWMDQEISVIHVFSEYTQGGEVVMLREIVYVDIFWFLVSSRLYQFDQLLTAEFPGTCVEYHDLVTCSSVLLFCDVVEMILFGFFQTEVVVSQISKAYSPP